MGNLRIVDVKAVSGTNLVARFTSPLASDLKIDNISIVSQTVNVPNCVVLSVTVIKDTLDITCQPMTEQAVYDVTFTSTILARFRDLNNTQFLIEDGQANVETILGPNDPDNPFYSNLKNFLHDQVYNLEDRTVASNVIRSFAVYFAKALYDIKQARNENYLTKLVLDEPKTRGAGPFDRLAQEGAYEIIRVGRFKDNFIVNGTINYATVPTALISLRQTSITDEVVMASSTDTLKSFNINTFTLNVSQNPVIRLDKVVFYYNKVLPNGGVTYQYNVSTLGYQILDQRYDPDFAFKYLTLQANQFRLSEKALLDPNFSLSGITKVTVSYTYKNLGRMVDPASVVVSKPITVLREVLDPLKNIFNLNFSPIIDGNGVVAKTAGVTFLDPNASPALSKKHPAFLNELNFSFENLPMKPGDYSVDYTTGTVYVYGATNTNDGTGAFPPLANYTYLHSFISLIDYVYDADSKDLVAVANRELAGSSATISFSYEDVLVPNIDYKAAVHQEALLERVQNRYIPSISAITVNNGPITNVFRIFNETQGIVYPVQRWSNNEIYFQSSNPPNILNTSAERVTFQPVLNDILFVNQEIVNSNSVRVLKMLLSNNNIIAATEDCIGTVFNTSLQPSNANIFTKELYYDATVSATVNTNYLAVGQYQVDYANGIIYVGVTAGQSYDLGTVSYKRPYIQPNFPHVINPISIYNRRNIFYAKDKEFDYKSFGEGSILPSSFNVADEQYLNQNTNLPYFLINGTIGAFINSNFIQGITNNVKSIRSLYEYSDLNLNASPINFVDSCTAADKNVTVGSKTISTLQIVEAVGPNYFVNTGLNLTYLSPNITVSFNVVRLSDSAVLWNGTGTYALGSPVRLQLPNINGVAAGNNVTVTVTLSINNSSRVVIDYNRGDLFIDYTYLADEIVVSYEYGDNVLDFRQSLNIPAGTNYFVSYRVGALRDALLKNFGTLIDIPLLNVFDGNFARERYREAIIAAMSSFIAGPTISAMSNIIETITHIKPEIIESVFQNWSLGSSSLFPAPIKVNGGIKTIKAKYGNGILVDQPGQSLTFPTSSNLSLGQGVLTSWVSPQWNGIDNDAKLTFNITKDGYAIDLREVFIGATEQHPIFSPKSKTLFSTAKNDQISPLGKPRKNHSGVYIYLAQDGYGVDGYSDGYTAALIDGYQDSNADPYADGYTYGAYQRWYVDVINPGSSQYKFTITSDGNHYNVKPSIPLASGSVLRTGTDTIQFNTGNVRQAINFVSDIDHYLFVTRGRSARRSATSPCAWRCRCR